MCFTLSGLVLLALAGSFGAVLLAAALVGTGSSVFHPESSRVARMASGGRHGLAQSIFQVGGNFGSSLGPLLAAVIIAPYGKGNVAWFVLAALLAIVVLAQISRWYSAQHRMNKGKPKATIINPLPRNKVVLAVSILLILIFSKYFYMASISSYYTFYLMQKFGLSIQNAQLHLFAFLFAVAAGTVIGGPVGDKIGRKYVIWGSILGVAPFTLILPYASLHWTGVLTVIIGFILASAFSAILVYAQELLPGRIGMVSGLFFGFAFGMGGTLTFQLASSLLQPVVGYWTDKYPMPWSLPIGMCFTLSGLVLLALAGSFGAVLLAAALVGTGSSVFHPESSRVARMASGGRHGLAQSIFQVGGNFGSSLGPLLAAVIIAPYGKGNVAWFVLAALLAIVVLAQISRWYSAQHRMNKGKPKATIINPLPRNKVVLAVSILLILIFSKYFYMASISSYYTFYLMQKFGLSIQNAQLHLFAFLFAVAAGTVIGGPVGDKIGRKYVIWGSILGVAPFTLILPYASLHWTGVLTVIIGFILASAFSAILVYAQELLPGRIGMVSGLFFGFAFGMGGLGAAVLGLIADHTSIELVYKICAFLPLLGMLTIFLPDNRHKD
ncbi:MFS transporter [Escherichia coli]|nr:MFS transporter [Escherichia coli]